MAGFLTNADIYNKTGALNKKFETFKHDIVIHKEPVQTFVTPSAPAFAGYTPISINQSNSNFIPVSGVYPALISYSVPASFKFREEVPNALKKDGVKIKVRPDAKDFIEQGSILRIDINGKSYKNIEGFSVQNFLGLIFYIYNLTEIS